MYYVNIKERKSLDAKIQAPFVMAEIRALRGSIFKSSPEVQRALAIAKHPRERRVVIERALERVDEHVVEGRLRMLRQPADEDLHRVDRVELLDSVLGKDVDHSGGKPAVGNDRDVLLSCVGVELFLLEHDLRVAAEIAEMHSGLDREAGHIVVEVVRDGTHDRVTLAHRAQHCRVVADVERRRNEART